MDRTAGLQDMQFFDRFEHDIGDLAHPVATIGFHTADIQVRKIIIRTAFLSRDADFGRSRVVVTLMKKQDINSFASSRVNVPSAIPFRRKEPDVGRNDRDSSRPNRSVR